MIFFHFGLAANLFHWHPTVWEFGCTLPKFDNKYTFPKSIIISVLIEKIKLVK